MWWKDQLTPDDNWGLRTWITLALFCLLPIGLTIAMFFR
jgi:hypothetical protein